MLQSGNILLQGASILKRIFLCILSLALTYTILTAVAPIRAAAADEDSLAGIVVSVPSGSLYVRAGASASSARLTSLPNGTYITLLDKTGSWWTVEYAAGSCGYCEDTYIREASGSYAAYVSFGSLNVRLGAGTEYAIQATLTKGTDVVVLTSSGGWSKILYSGTKTGYVNSGYLSVYGSTSYPAVSLSPPSFTQTDSRWSGIAIGTSGGTIFCIGCLTTSLAMAESYRTGRTVYPDEMAASLTFTASGSAYWPSNYTFSDDCAYLGTIYSLLHTGKPVIFGATNSSGGQHWVLVTGYTGGSTLTADGFTINDPGSAGRTTLQQVLDNYPDFCRLAYYQ